MRAEKYFWSHFEEPAVKIAFGNTQARNILFGTTTRTAMREEPDQDPQNERYSAIPQLSIPAGTKTLTESREEPDQDDSCSSYRAI